MGADDVINRPCKNIFANFCAEHEKTGAHKASLTTTLWQFEEASYEGTGVAQTITLTKTDLDVMYVRIMSGESAYTFFLTDGIANLTYSSDPSVAPTADWIKSTDNGSFDVGTTDEVNKNGSTYYYLVAGPYAP